MTYIHVILTDTGKTFVTQMDEYLIQTGVVFTFNNQKYRINITEPFNYVLVPDGETRIEMKLYKIES
jgi:hypothetical protein